MTTDGAGLGELKMNESGKSASSLPLPVDVLGIPVHPLSPELLVKTIVAWGNEPGFRRVYNVNVHAMNFAHDLPEFRRYLEKADLVFCDGYGVKWGAEIVGARIPQRMTPPDWIDAFAAASGRANQSVFALGDEDGIAEEFQRMLVEQHPNYRNAGSHHGFFEKDGPENERLIKRINASGATHLLVGFGMPLQERWIEANAHRLSVRVVLAVGALFRWYTGVDQRAPKWMTDNGLEWLARLAANPVRHFRRYVVGNPRFIARAVAWRIRHEASRHSPIAKP